MEDRLRREGGRKKKKGTVDGIMELDRETSTTSLITHQHLNRISSSTTSSSNSLDSPPMDSDALLRRRNTVPQSMIPTKLDIPMKLQSSSFPMKLQSSSFPITNGDKASLPNCDFELFSLRSKKYTSLKDLMIPGSPSAAAIQSPRDSSGIQSCYEISIRNRLVKQAAWAYLQPMSTSPDSSGRYSFRRMWVRFSSVFSTNPINACFGFIHRKLIPSISRAFNRLLGVLGVLRNRGEKQ